MFDLSKQVAVVTGASSGLGQQIALALARQGATIAILARRMERLEELAPKLTQAGAEDVLPVRCDVTSTKDIENAAKIIEDKFKHVDILFNVAGATTFGGVVDMNDEDWDFNIATDETSVFKMTRTFSRIMQKNHYGRIINIASSYGLVGNTEKFAIAYHTAKGAVVNFTRAVAAELAPDGITCNAICPGYFETELTKAILDTPRFQEYAKTHVPMRRYGKPGELDAAAVFLASKEASYVTGLIMPVDGGYTAV